jgi:hypothetical protein
MPCKDDETIPFFPKWALAAVFPPLIICCLASSIDMSPMGSAAIRDVLMDNPAYPNWVGYPSYSWSVETAHRTYGSAFSSVCDSAKGSQKPENISSTATAIGVRLGERGLHNSF